MKNKLKIFLCVVMIAVFSFGTCATAYAYTGYPTSLDKAVSIINSYYKDMLGDVTPICLYKENSTVRIMYLPSRFFEKDITIPKDREISVGMSSNCYFFEFDYSNMYSKPTLISKHDHSFIYQYLPVLNSDTIIDSYNTFYDYEGNLLFQQGTTQSPNPTNPDSTIQSSNILSNLLNKNSTMLKGVLNEILALLPLLLPVLITFLAIRKGIRFTLQTLRSA